MFIDFSIKDLIDILLVAYLLYQTYRLMKDSGSINIFIGILVFFFRMIYAGSLSHWARINSWDVFSAS